MITLWYLVVSVSLTTSAVPVTIGPFETQEACLERQALFDRQAVLEPCWGQRVDVVPYVAPRRKGQGS